MKSDNYSFCEPVETTGYGKWHIRKLTKKGHFYGGGVDTTSLCGHVKIRMGWDVEVPIRRFHLETNTCPKCLEIYTKEIKK